MNKTQDYGLKPASKYEIIRHWDNFKNIFIDDSYPPSSISLSSKSFVNIIF